MVSILWHVDSLRYYKKKFQSTVHVISSLFTISHIHLPTIKYCINIHYIIYYYNTFFSVIVTFPLLHIKAYRFWSANLRRPLVAVITSGYETGRLIPFENSRKTGSSSADYREKAFRRGSSRRERANRVTVCYRREDRRAAATASSSNFDVLVPRSADSLCDTFDRTLRAATARQRFAASSGRGCPEARPSFGSIATTSDGERSFAHIRVNVPRGGSSLRTCTRPSQLGRAVIDSPRFSLYSAQFFSLYFLSFFFFFVFL